MKKILNLIVVAVLLATTVQSQNKPQQGSAPRGGGPQRDRDTTRRGNPNQRGEMGRQNPNRMNQDSLAKVRMNMRRNSYIIGKLMLTPDETKAFIAAYEEYNGKKEELKKANREVISKLFEDSVAMKKMDNKALVKLAEDEIEIRQQEVDLFKKYNDKFKTILPPAKFAKLYYVEDMFYQDAMLKSFKRDGGPQGGPNSRRGGEGGPEMRNGAPAPGMPSGMPAPERPTTPQPAGGTVNPK